MSSNERPFEYLSKLFQVCSEAQNPSAMSEANFRAQKFFSDLEIIRRTAEPNSYFRVIPTEGLRKILPEEKDFPIAFVHLIHDDVGIFEMFLAVMYRPQNFHCVHIDSKVNFSILPKYLDTLMLVYHCHKPVFTPKMEIFRRARIREGGLPLPLAFQYLILLI